MDHSRAAATAARYSILSDVMLGFSLSIRQHVIERIVTYALF